MANILKGIDKIETVAGTVVDLDNIQATGGGASSATLGFTRSEDANAIYYDMGEAVVNNNIADGHSASATDHYTFGGWANNSAQSGTAKVSYDTGSNSDGWAGTDAVSGHVYAAGGSSGDSFLRIGGYNGSNNISQNCKYSLTTTNTSQGWSSVVSGVRTAAGASDGQHALMMAGWDNSLTRGVQRFSFSDSSYASYWGTGINNDTESSSSGHRSSAEGISNGTSAFCVGGGDNNGFLTDIQILSFTDSSIDSATHGALDKGRSYCKTASNADDAFTSMGYNSGNDRNLQKWSMNDTGTTSTTFAELTRNYSQAGASGNGVDMILSGGHNDLTQALFGEVTKMSMASGSFDDSFSSSRNAHSPVTGSGTSA